MKHDAWSKKFGGILKSWTNVGLALEQTVLFQPWGHLKTDMLRRRYDKLYSETLEALRKKGVDLDAIGESEMTDLERKVRHTPTPPPFVSLSLSLMADTSLSLSLSLDEL